MYIYNTTFNIETNIVNQCLIEIQTELLPELLDTNLIDKIIFTEVLNQPQAGQNFSLQIFCATKAHLKQFQNFHNHIIENWVKKYNSKVVFFQTSMRIVEEQG